VAIFSFYWFAWNAENVKNPAFRFYRKAGPAETSVGLFPFGCKHFCGFGMMAAERINNNNIYDE